MAVEENVQLMRRWFQEVWNENKPETIYALLSAKSEARGQSGAQDVIRGPEEFAQFVKYIRGAFPDIKVTIEDIFGTQDKVVVRWSATMTHTGDSLGIPGTGKPVRSTGISIARIENGQIIEGFDSWDQIEMWKQIGAFTEPETSPLAKTA